MAVTTQMSRRDPRHGTSNGYSNLGCRCQPCRDAWAQCHFEYLERHPIQREKNCVRMAITRYERLGRPLPPHFVKRARRLGWL